MLCPSAFQPALSPFMELRWPVRSLWPETRPLFFHMEQEMVRRLQEMRHDMEAMERLHRHVFDQIDPSASAASAFRPFSFQVGREGERFALTLDTQDFSPEELSVTQVGRRLRVNGRTEKKQEDGRGSFSYRCQEFRQELDLPDGVDPETVSCSLADGRLHIQAPQQALAGGGKERVVPISVSPALACTPAPVAATPATPAPAPAATPSPMPAPPTPNTQGNIPIPVRNKTKST